MVAAYYAVGVAGQILKVTGPLQCELAEAVGIVPFHCIADRVADHIVKVMVKGLKDPM
jgi:hypothetical protein